VTHTLGLIGVPSSAGAHWPGQEQTPAALRAAGLIARLRAGGISVVDHGDLPAVRCVPQPPADSRPGSTIARHLADRIEQMGVAHMVAEPGAASALSHIGPRTRS
jgi:hypothetical protein